MIIDFFYISYFKINLFSIKLAIISLFNYLKTQQF